MKQQKPCNPEDMIRFLLALCCQDDSSTTPVSRNDTLDRCFKECSNKAAQVAQLKEMRQKLDV